MPRFFSDIQDGDEQQRDEEGLELPNGEAVRKTAMRLLPDIARDEVPLDGDRRSFTVIVTDMNGKPSTPLP